MKRLFLPVLTLALCPLASAQFRERPSTTARRASERATHVEGNLYKALDFAVDGRVSALSFSPKGDYLAVATTTTLSLFNESGTRKLLIWDAVKEPGVPFEDRPPLHAAVTFSADGKQLFFCGPQGLMMWAFDGGLSLDHDPVRAWTDPTVYNLCLADGNQVVCAAKKGSSHKMQVRSASDGKMVWEKESGLLPITSLRSSGATVRAVVGSVTGSQCFWSDWTLANGHQTPPVDLGEVSAFSASQSPDGRSLAVVKWDLSIINIETGEAKVALAPYHAHRYWWRSYYYEWPYDTYRWRNGSTVDTGWTTLFSPDGNHIVTLGKEAVFYGKSTGAIEARIYFSNNPFPFPSPPITQAETDGVGAFSTDGQKFALVRQSRVLYSLSRLAGSKKFGIRRQPQGDSGVEIYALDAGG